MRTIWKFPFPITDEFELNIPLGAKMLHVEEQHGIPCLWAECDPGKEARSMEFVLYGTGHPMEEYVGQVYVGTFLSMDGDLVFHLYHL